MSHLPHVILFHTLVDYFALFLLKLYVVCVIGLGNTTVSSLAKVFHLLVCISIKVN